MFSVIRTTKVQDLTAMDTVFATLACCLLALGFAVAQTERNNLSIPDPTTTPGLNLIHNTTMVTSSDFTAIPTLTESTTPFTTPTWNNETFNKTTAATTESTSQLQTLQSTTIMTPLTNSTSLMTKTSSDSTFTAIISTIKTTVGYMSTPDTTAITTANSSHTVNPTSDSMYGTTQVLGLNTSEKNMTILFSVVLGTFALALVVFMYHRCQHKFQYFHQPLNDTDDTADAFVADEDTLVISGGLYDGHPIYDNVPPAPADQSQFRLQSLH